jgi:hypothetical protein
MSSNLITADNGVSSGVTGITQSAGSDGTLQLRTTTSGGTATTALTIDNSQNVGVGVTPFANTIGKSIDLVNGPGWFGYSNISYLTTNAYFNSVWLYKANGYATLYQQSSGTHIWQTASSGSTNGTIAFNQVMTLNNSGTLTFNQSGQGIQFTNSSALTNSTLNDYETGTFTLTANPDSGSITLQSTTAYYTKIGRLVNIIGSINVLSASSPSGNVYFPAPFTCANTASAGSLSIDAAINSISGLTLTPRIQIGQSIFYLQLYNSSTGGLSGAASSLKASSLIDFNITYITSF